ncbi:DUF4352 domain-containing protein [Rhodococcus sp. NPDC058521]|uniref:DUF4352 domain-containing protein n=1 Tax=Rhodococcus sp. NPDC058521 TaxID=3346536 RepID=UPI003649789A
MNAQPGWYPDPKSRRKIRYWDGFRWTSHAKAVPGPAPAPAVAEKKPPASSGSSGNGWKFAAAGLGVALVALIGFFAWVIVDTGSRDSTSARVSHITTTRTTTVKQAPVAAPTPVPAPAPAPAPVEPPARITVTPAELPPPPPVTDIGKPVRDGKFEFVVHSWDGSTAQVSVKNIGDEPKSLAMSNQYLFDKQGRKFEPEFDWSSDLAFADLNPGQSVSGALVYALSGASPDYLELHDSIFSGGVEVRLG